MELCAEFTRVSSPKLLSRLLPRAHNPHAMQEPLSKQLAAHLPKWADAEQASSAAEGAADLDRRREKIEKLGAGLLLV